MDKIRNIALITRPWLNYFFLDLARVLRRRYDSQIHLYARHPGEMFFYEPFVKDGTIDSITFAGQIHESISEEIDDPAVIMAKTAAYEKRLKRTINSLSASDKLLGAPFALGGLHFPRSRHYIESDLTRFYASFVAAFEFWEKEFADKSIDCVLNGTAEIAAAARINDIPYRHLIEIGYENYCHWVANEFHENPLIEKRFRENENPSRSSADILEPYLSARLGNKARLEAFPKLSNFLNSAMRTTVQHAKANIRGYKTGYPYLEDMSYNWRLFRDFRNVLRTHTTSLDEIRGRDFIYFPLAREPEVPYMMMSPEYFYQLPAVASLVRDLPAGWRLAVKEHISAIGPRPREFYDQIRYFKQVSMMDIRERGVDCVQAAKGIATIAGSAGIEAAVSGKPVISFGRHNSYCFLDHVMVVTDEAQLADYVKAIAEDEIDFARARRDGARFIEAMVGASFDMRGFDWSDREGYEAAAVEDCADLLVTSLSTIPATPGFIA